MMKPWEYLEQRFGVEEDRIEGKIEEISGDYWLVSVEKPDADIENRGIRILRAGNLGLKPTTYALQLFEDRIERSVVKVGKQELLKLLEKSEMIPRKDFTEGYVALKYGENIVGCGFYKDGVVSSRIPENRSKELLKIIS